VRSDASEAPRVEIRRAYGSYVRTDAAESLRTCHVRVGHELKTGRLALAAAPQARFVRGAPTLFDD